MKLYLISQTVNRDDDTYGSAVVCAPTEEAARNTHPGGYDEDKWGISGIWEWCNPKDVKVVEIGTANPDTPEGVVCASFNAG